MFYIVTEMGWHCLPFMQRPLAVTERLKCAPAHWLGSICRITNWSTILLLMWKKLNGLCNIPETHLKEFLFHSNRAYQSLIKTRRNFFSFFFNSSANSSHSVSSKEKRLSSQNFCHFSPNCMFLKRKLLIGILLGKTNVALYVVLNSFSKTPGANVIN